jgi:hypothetical protein
MMALSQNYEGTQTGHKDQKASTKLIMMALSQEPRK